MARVKRAVNAHKKRRETLERASGYRGQRSRLYRKAKEQVTHSMVYNYRDRKARKGDFRQLWITRINAAARANGMTYNRFIQGLKAAGIEVDRRMLAELAVNDAAAFSRIGRGALAPPSPADQRRRLTLSSGPASPPLSAKSKRVTSARRLFKRGFRSADRAFLAEGPQAVREAVALAATKPGAVQDIFVTDDARRRHREIIDAAESLRIPTHSVGDEVMASMAQTVTPQGMVAVCSFLDRPCRRRRRGQAVARCGARACA